MQTRFGTYATLTAILWCCAISMSFAQDTKPVAQAPVFKVGDSWKFQLHDIGNKKEPTWFINTVTLVDDKQVVTLDDNSEGRKFWSIYDVPSQKPQLRFAYVEAAPDKRGRKTGDWSGNDAEVQFPLEVGRNWSIQEKSPRLENELKAEVTAYERIRIQAGEFDAFKIVIKGWWKNVQSGNTGPYQRTVWYAPVAKRVVKIEGFTRVTGSLWDQWTQELLEFKSQP